MAISHPTDPRIRGLAATVLTSDIPPWEFDIKAVEPGSDVVEISDWERRLRRKQIERGQSRRRRDVLLAQPTTDDGHHEHLPCQEPC